MRNTLTALLSAASFCAFAGAIPAAAQTPTIPSQTGAPAYSYDRTAPVPAPVGECQIIAGNRVCNGAPAYGYGYGPWANGYAPGGPIGAVVAAPVTAAGAVVAAPFAGAAPTRPSLTGAPAYSYHRTAPVPAVGGECQIIAGNRVCTASPAYGYGYGYGPGPFGFGPGGPIGAAVAAPVSAAGAVVGAPVAAGGALAAAPFAWATPTAPAPGGQCNMIAGNRVCTGYIP